MKIRCKVSNNTEKIVEIRQIEGNLCGFRKRSIRNSISILRKCLIPAKLHLRKVVTQLVVQYIGILELLLCIKALFQDIQVAISLF